MRVKCNLKVILDERKISIRQLAQDTGIGFESLRRLYNDEAKSYTKNVIEKVCKELDIEINELLILVEDEKSS